MSLVSALAHYLFPPRCAGCGLVGTTLCPDCFVKISSYYHAHCPGCLKPKDGGFPHQRCQGSAAPDYLFVPFVYKGVIRNLIHGVKINRDRRALDVLGTLLVEEIESDESLRRFMCTVQPIVIPVPMSRRRRNERGFNQSEILTQFISTAFNLKRDTNILSKRHTPRQSSLNARQRRFMIDKAISHGNCSVGHSAALLVDDVVTTGATLRACTQALRRSGVDKVWAVTIAH